MSVIDTIKSHPVPIVVGVVAFALVLSMRGSGAPASGPSSGDVALQTNTNATNVQLAGISAQAQIAMTQSNNALAAARSNNATQQIQTGAQLAASQSSSLMQATLAQIASNTNIAQSNNALTTNLASIQANIKNHAGDLAVQSQIASNNFSLGLAGLNTQQNIAGITGQTQLSLLTQAGQNQVNAINAQNSMSGGDWISSIVGGINGLTGGPQAANPGGQLLGTFGGGGGGSSGGASSGGASSGGSGGGMNMQSLASLASIAALFFA
jgi:hypothetical protein